MAGETKASGPSAAADRIRETAKWLTVSLAAIGGVLVAGSQLSDLGALDTSTGRFAIAVTGGMAAAAAATVILGLAIWTATTPAVSLSDLANHPPRGINSVINDPVYTDGKAIADLNKAYNDAIEKRDRAFARLDEADTPDNRKSATAADEAATYLSGVVLALLDVVAYKRLAYRWRRAGYSSLALGLIAAAGIGTFAWAANPPPDAVASVVTPGTLNPPKTVQVVLSEEGQQALRKSLGNGCPFDQPMNGMRLANTDAGPDVLITEPNCQRIRFVAVPDWASTQ